MSTATQRDTQRPTVAPSARPTALPAGGHDEEVLLEGIRLGSQSYIPLDIAVPRRTEANEVDGLSHRARFLLLHVDGTSTLARIARATSLPQSEVIGEFLELLASGTVELVPAEEGPAPHHRSGIFVHG